MESKKRKSAGKRQTASRVKKDPSGPSSNPLLDLLGFVAGGIGGLFKFITGGLFGLLSKIYSLNFQGAKLSRLKLMIFRGIRSY